MQILQTVIPILVLISLVSMEIDLGLHAKIGDLTCVLRRPSLLLKAVVSVYVIVPIAAAVMIELFPLTPVARGGIMLMAVSSVPPLAQEKALKAGGDRAYTYGLYVAIVLLSVILVPAMVAVASRRYGIDVPLGPLPVLEEVLLQVALPVVVGLVIRHIAPRFAERVAPIIGRLATVLLVMVLIPIVIIVWPAIMALIGNGTLLAMALVAVIAIASGHLLGGPEPENRVALATMASTRHPGVAIMIAGAAGFDKRVTAAIIAVLLVGAFVGLAYQAWLKRRRKPPAPATAMPA